MSKTKANNITPAGSAALLFDAPHDSSKQVTQSTSSQYQPPPGLTCPARAANDRQKTITTAAKSSFAFLIVRDSFQSEILARRIIALAEVALSLRQSNALELLGQQLKSIQRYANLGAYYQGMAALRQPGELGRAKQLLEQAAAAPARLRARAILSLGVVESYKGDIDAEMRHYAQALGIEEASHLTRIETASAIAVLRASGGDHPRALALLESLHPIARRFARTSPRLYLNLLNSLAVEYAECDHVEAAREAFKPVLGSTLINSIAEFRETARQLAEAEPRKAPAVAVASIVNKSDERSRALILDPRQRRRACRRIIKPDKADSTTARQRDSLAKSGVIAEKSERPRSLIIKRVQLCAPIHAPPFISVV